MKKVIIFLVVIIGLFIGVAYLTKVQNEEKTNEKNPYGKDSLDPETVALLDDPNYQNIILPEELEKKLDNKEDVTVYFFSSTCSHCKRATPVVAPLAKQMGVELHQFNLLEFEDGWDKYKIESTPTIVQFKDGKETNRLVGNQGKQKFQEFFNQNSK